MLKHIFTLIWNRKGKNLLIVTEIFFAFIILFSVLAFVFYNVSNYRQPLGFVTEPLWLVYLDFEGRDSTNIVETKHILQRELEQHSNIEKVAYSGFSTPIGNSHSATGNDDNGFYLFSYLFDADDAFAETVGLNIVEGRWFQKEDATAKYPPMVINKKLQEEHLKGKPVIDSILNIHGAERRVVGIVDHFRYMGQFNEEVSLSFLYEPIENEDKPALYIRLKDGVGAEFEEELSNSIAQLGQQDDVFIMKIEQRRVRDNKSTLVPMVALLIICGFLIINVALGLFGVLWYNISKRKGEIGLRRVLGAYRSVIAQQFIIEILLIASLGILVAMLFCVQVPLMEFFEVPGIYFYQAILASTMIILALVLICALYPSQQAAQISPAVALHEE